MDEFVCWNGRGAGRVKGDLSFPYRIEQFVAAMTFDKVDIGLGPFIRRYILDGTRRLTLQIAMDGGTRSTNEGSNSMLFFHGGEEAKCRFRCLTIATNGIFRLLLQRHET
mmetsp:Transcript_11858/g.18703  ORF Transcript_11858/g.18703 Transcript_11858/m.18703 type:complete len:110 (+) Transcript_11858:570-899(+)